MKVFECLKFILALVSVLFSVGFLIAHSMSEGRKSVELSCPSVQIVEEYEQEDTL